MKPFLQCSYSMEYISLIMVLHMTVLLPEETLISPLGKDGNFFTISASHGPSKGPVVGVFNKWDL